MPRTEAPRCRKNKPAPADPTSNENTGLEALAAYLSRSEKPQPPFWAQDHGITPIPCLPSDPAARAEGRQACSQQNGARRWHFQPTALPATPASFCPATMWCCPGLGCSTISLMAFSLISLSGRCPGNPISTD